MLGKFILEQRKKHNLTQDFLASKIGVSRPTYVQIEQGERDLTITEARKLSDIFGIVFDDFVQGKDTSAMVEVKKSVKKIKVEGKYFNYPQRKYLPIREPDLTKLKDARELRHIDEVIARLGDKNATELSEYSHEDTPWLVAKENQPLDYEAVFYRTPKTSVRNYDEQN